MERRGLTLGTVLLAAAAACGRGDDGPPPAGAAAVDSALTTEVALDRFRAGRAPLPGLEGDVRSRDTLVARFALALARNDAAALSTLEMNRAEFADLYYPGSPQSRPPYELPPETMWFQLRQQSERGLTRLMDRFGGKPVRTVSAECDAPRSEGENLIHAHCRVLTATDSIPVGSIIERQGRFRILSFANDL